MPQKHVQLQAITSSYMHDWQGVLSFAIYCTIGHKLSRHHSVRLSVAMATFRRQDNLEYSMLLEKDMHHARTHITPSMLAAYVLCLYMAVIETAPALGRQTDA